jgi:SNF2 family DNA or RNA helicase
VAALQRDLTWCVTGTELHNSIDDLWSYMALLKIPAIKTYQSFERNFKCEGEIVIQNLKLAYSSIALRRSKEDPSVGLLDQLPKRKYELNVIELSEAELRVYNSILYPTLQMLNESNLQKMVIKGILERITRLRQICCHPVLIEGEEATKQCTEHSTKTRKIVRD